MRTNRPRFFPGFLLGFYLSASLFILVGGGQAQIKDGDLLLAGMGIGQNGQILSYRPSTGSFTTLLAMKGFNHIIQSVGMATDNRTWVFSWYDYTQKRGFFGRLFLPGLWTTLYRFPAGNGAQAHDMDAEGDILAATRTGTVLEMSSVGNVVQTLFKGPALLNALVMDPNGGGAVAAEFGGIGPERILMIDQHTSNVKTLVSGISSVRCLAADVRSNGFLVGRPTPPFVFRLKGGRLTTFSTLNMGNALVALEDGTYFGAGGTGSGHALHHVDSLGRLKTSTSLASRFQTVRAIAVHGSRRLGGFTQIQTNKVYSLLLDSRCPEDVYRPYAVLPALTWYPGFPVAPGKHLALNPDALSDLILKSKLPIFMGFLGILDGGGMASPRLLIPPGFRGLRIYLAGVILDPARPWPLMIQRVTNTVTITLP